MGKSSNKKFNMASNFYGVILSLSHLNFVILYHENAMMMLLCELQQHASAMPANYGLKSTVIGESWA